jgi:hypothetical protein
MDEKGTVVRPSHPKVVSANAVDIPIAAEITPPPTATTGHGSSGVSSRWGPAFAAATLKRNRV